MKVIPKAKKWKVILSGGQEYELDHFNAEKFIARMKGSRAQYSYEVVSGPSIGATFRMDHVAAIFPVRTQAEEKEAIAMQKEEQRRKEVRIQNVAEKIKNNANTGNSSVDLCDVLHKLQIETDEEGNEVRRFFDESIEPRFSTLNDRKVFFPVCTKCGWRGQMLKARSILPTFNMDPGEVLEYDEEGTS